MCLRNATNSLPGRAYFAHVVKKYDASPDWQQLPKEDATLRLAGSSCPKKMRRFAWLAAAAQRR